MKRPKPADKPSSNGHAPRPRPKPGTPATLLECVGDLAELLDDAAHAAAGAVAWAGQLGDIEDANGKLLEQARDLWTRAERIAARVEAFAAALQARRDASLPPPAKPSPSGRPAPSHPWLGARRIDLAGPEEEDLDQ